MRIFQTFLIVTAGALASHAESRLDLRLDFDSLTAGAAADAVLPASFRFDNAAWLPSLDSRGNPLPGTERWRVDPSAPAVTVDDPASYGRGPAPSPDLALEALFQPVLLSFPESLEVHRFTVTLDLDEFGVNGFLQGHEVIAVQFLGYDGGLLTALPVDQTTPGFLAVLGNDLANVSQVLLPAGAFYDNLSLSLVSTVSSQLIPEGDSRVAILALMTLGGLVWLIARRHRARAEA